MSGTFEQAAIIAKDPYAWLSEAEIKPENGVYPEFKNPLEIIVEAMRDMIFPAPKKIKFPVEPTGHKGWLPGIDPESRLIPESVVPGILEGNPMQRVDQPTPSGKPTEGEATFINFICDCSGSMGSADMGFKPGFTPMQRSEMAKVIAVSIIEACAEEGHYFQVVGYDTSSWSIWPGPSNDYAAAIAYFLNPPEDGPDPFAPRGGTQAGQAMRFALNNMEEFIVSGKWKVKSCVTFMIADDDISIGTKGSPAGNTYCGAWDERFREYGPVYYCFTVPITPEGTISPAGYGMERAMISCRNQLKEYYGSKYETEDCSTSFGLFWNPQTNTTIGAGTLIDITQGRGKNRCTGKTSK